MTCVSHVVRQPPASLTQDEQDKLLRVTGEHKAGFRDHVIFSLAIGTGLREFEIAALNVGDVYNGPERPKTVVPLRVFKGHKRERRVNGAPQTVFVPDALRHKLKAFWRWKVQNEEATDPNEPLFRSTRAQRISPRTLHHAFATWQKRAGFERAFKFHALRHTCGMNLYRKSRDIRIVQRQLRHSDINTTTIYATPNDQDLAIAMRDLPC